MTSTLTALAAVLVAAAAMTAPPMRRLAGWIG